MTDQTPDRTSYQWSKPDAEAVDWLVRLTEIAADSPDPTLARKEIQDEFNQWATGSPRNLQSFLETASVFEALGECEAEMIHELVAHVDPRGNIVSVTPAGRPPALPTPSESAGSGNERVNRSWGKTGALAAAAVLAAVAAILWQWSPGITYRTQAGEWRRIRLEDGSVVILSEQSEFRVSFSREQRKTSLPRGHAVFDVSRDAHRPFSVSIGAAEILALGTRFDVEHRNGPARVTVVDGVVRVNMTSEPSLPWANRLDRSLASSQEESDNRTMTLRKDEGAQVERQGIIPSDQSEVANVVASQRDELLFDDQPLSVVAERINRENRRELRIGDTTAGEKRISGRYRTDHPEGLVLAIRELYPDVTIRDIENGWVLEGHKRQVASR